MSTAYFDAAAAAPLHPAARQALIASLDDGWADPAKLYSQARRARQLYDAAVAATADALGVRAQQVTFCASGSQACYLAVAGLFGAGRDPTGVLAHSAIEHSALLSAAEHHVHAGGRAVAVGVDRLGRVDVAAFAETLRAGVAVAALMSANHEVGTVQPVAEVARLCAEAGVPLLVDAAASVGRQPVPDGWSVLTASAHKWGGPPGVGVLVVAPGVRFAAPDAVNAVGAALPLVVAAAASLRAVVGQMSAEDARLRPLVDRVRQQVPRLVPDVEVVGDPVERLPHVVTFSCLYVDGEALLHALDRRGFAVSSGSSCTSATGQPSHVLDAMGVLSHGNVRLSFHRETTVEQVDRFLAELPEVIAHLRADVGVR